MSYYKHNDFMNYSCIPLLLELRKVRLLGIYYICIMYKLDLTTNDYKKIWKQKIQLKGK
jgi:hypothetical protein